MHRRPASLGGGDRGAREAARRGRLGGARPPPRSRAPLGSPRVAPPAGRPVRCCAEGGTIITTLILTQGGLAGELLAAAQKIVGDGSRLAALGLDWDDTPEAARLKLERTIAELPREDGLLILTDIYGGTPSNLALALRAAGRVEVVSGVNLPMVVRLACLGEEPRMSLEETADWIRGKARASICRGEHGARGGRRPRSGSDGRA